MIQNELMINNDLSEWFAEGELSELVVKKFIENQNLAKRIKSNETYKILLLFPGIGVGINKLHQILQKTSQFKYIHVTAIEIDRKIARSYKIFNPDTEYITHEIVTGDVYQLIKQIDVNEYHLILGSPDCQSHSVMQRINGYDMPDFRLFSLLVYLCAKVRVHKNDNSHQTVFIIENTSSWYNHLVPFTKIGRHIYYSNIELNGYDRKEPKNIRKMNIVDYVEYYEFSENSQNRLQSVKGDKRQLLRNGIHPSDVNYLIDNALSPKFIPVKLDVPINIEFASERFYTDRSDILIKQIFPQYLEIENLNTGMKFLTDIQIIHCWMSVMCMDTSPSQYNSREELRDAVNDFMEEQGIPYQRIMNAPHSLLSNVAFALMNSYKINNLEDLEFTGFEFNN